MKIIDINDFVFKGQKLFNIGIGDNVTEILRLKNHNFTLYGDIKNGYYYLPSGYRFGFSENQVDEIGIDFNTAGSIINFHSVNTSDFPLNKKKIHQILNALNDLSVNWQPVPNADNNYLMIRIVNSGVIMIFDIYEGTIDKISLSNLFLNESCLDL